MGSTVKNKTVPLAPAVTEEPRVYGEAHAPDQSPFAGFMFEARRAYWMHLAAPGEAFVVPSFLKEYERVNWSRVSTEKIGSVLREMAVYPQINHPGEVLARTEMTEDERKALFAYIVHQGFEKSGPCRILCGTLLDDIPFDRLDELLQVVKRLAGAFLESGRPGDSRLLVSHWDDHLKTETKPFSGGLVTSTEEHRPFYELGRSIQGLRIAFDPEALFFQGFETIMPQDYGTQILFHDLGLKKGDGPHPQESIVVESVVQRPGALAFLEGLSERNSLRLIAPRFEAEMADYFIFNHALKRFLLGLGVLASPIQNHLKPGRGILSLDSAIRRLRADKEASRDWQDELSIFNPQWLKRVFPGLGYDVLIHANPLVSQSLARQDVLSLELPREKEPSGVMWDLGMILHQWPQKRGAYRLEGISSWQGQNWGSNPVRRVKVTEWHKRQRQRAQLRAFAAKAPPEKPFHEISVPVLDAATLSAHYFSGPTGLVGLPVGR